MPNLHIVREEGFEPSHGGFKGPCLTAWLLPNTRSMYVLRYGVLSQKLRSYFAPKEIQRLADKGVI